MRNVFCIKYKETLLGLDTQPYPGDLGQRIYDNISQRAWTDWMEHQTKLINELKLKVYEPKAQDIIRKEAEQFFFGEAKIA